MLVGLAVVIALLMWLVSLLGGPKTAAPPVTTPPPATTRTPSPPDSLQATALPAPASTPPATATDQPTAPSASTTPAALACDPAVLTLDVTGPGAVKAGATAQLTVTVTNAGSEACTFTFDAQFGFRIVSGTDEIWSIADCGQWAPTGSHTLAPGAAATWQTTWDRHRSQASCKVVPTTLKPGTYVATASYTGASSAQLVMLLTA